MPSSPTGSAHDLQGPTVRVDTDHLRRLIERRGFTVREASMNAGLHETVLYHVLKRGSCKEPTLDKLACSLGTHMYELEVTR